MAFHNRFGGKAAFHPMPTILYLLHQALKTSKLPNYLNDRVYGQSGTSQSA
jgi:hypothetical protein